MNDEPSAESYARLAKAQAEYRGPSAQQSAEMTLDRLRLERDATVSAGLPTRYGQQTIVGNVSGAGNRHVIEDTPSQRRITNIPTQIFDNLSSRACSPSAPPGSGTYVWGSIDGTCQWISTTDCS